MITSPATYTNLTSQAETGNMTEDSPSGGDANHEIGEHCIRGIATVPFAVVIDQDDAVRTQQIDFSVDRCSCTCGEEFENTLEAENHLRTIQSETTQEDQKNANK